MRNVVAAALLVLAVPALAKEVAGVKVPDTMQVGGKNLQLNGAGLRKKFVIKVYVGALYLTDKTKDAKTAIESDAPKAVRMTFLREVTKDQVMDAFKEGFEKNSGGEAKALKAKLDGINKIFPARIREGQTMVVRYAPGEGTTLGIEGDQTATVQGKDFADALFRNWLGKEPADEDLKDGMLGK